MDQSIGSIVAVIASTVLTARIITGQSNERALSRTPTDLKLGTTVKYCHTFLSKPASWNSSRKMASDSRTVSRRSRVIAPQTAHSQTRTGERLTVDHIVW